MAEIIGLTGLRPSKEKVAQLTSPPYDVIKSGSRLEELLKANRESLFHIILGPEPEKTLKEYQTNGVLKEDGEPCFYVYEQKWNGGSRLGFFGAVKVDDYSQKNVIRHEKTFDSKVQGRIQLAQKTKHTIGPIFLLTASPIQETLKSVQETLTPEYDFVSDFKSHSELHGIANRIFRVPQNSEHGKELAQAIAQNPLYIADGHHRYHAALKNKQTHTLAYIVQEANILAYNRVIRGKKLFADIKNKLKLEKVSAFATPPKYTFCIYTPDGSYHLKAENIPEDVVGKLDCSLLEKELYPHLGVTHDMILDEKYFDYYSEWDLETMKQLVDQGKYDIAVALHPVSIQDLMDVANAGLINSDVVMPEKSTFFAPKILSGLFLYRHQH